MDLPKRTSCLRRSISMALIFPKLLPSIRICIASSVRYWVMRLGGSFRLISKLSDSGPNTIGDHEDPTRSKVSGDLMMSDSCKTHGSDTAALRAIGFAPELAGCNCCLQIGGDGMGGAGEDAFLGRLGRVVELIETGLVHVQNRIQWAEADQFRDHGRTYLRCQNLRSFRPHLWCEDAHPDLPRLGPCAPEAKK